ncbi:fumarate hydratase [Methanocella sp. CWC-04]|uniref:Fumarate hydratase n=1 Tax=Methanooceanicella nereidis TaxID=2052831 RepID=A0AAP2W7A2_9EURY|nr:fumarate hydratase [Methanocella sp. CWC-04]MCD1296203.1 fumarate hydratase [Methanocella sp. CWC-04]
MLNDKIIEDTVVSLLRIAVTRLPHDVVSRLEEARTSEKNDTARRELGLMLENIGEAGKCSLPMCQDTGIPVFFVKMGSFNAPGLEDAIARGVRRATAEIPLRKNVVHPLTRVNTGDNTGRLMPIISYSYSNNDHIEMTVMPKGAGSENMSAMAMLNPSQGMQGIKKFVLETVVKAEGKPCPPTIIGIGIGGSSDMCMALAKKALIRPAGSHNADPDIAMLEDELLEMINSTGIGPMGLGGDTTSLAVHIEYAYCHTASLPVGINIQCYAARRASAKLFEDGKVDFGCD